MSGVLYLHDFVYIIIYHGVGWLELLILSKGNFQSQRFGISGKGLSHALFIISLFSVNDFGMVNCIIDAWEARLCL